MSATATEQPLYIQHLRIKNFMAIESLEADPLGRHMHLSGRNASGKTSAAEALWQALCGSAGRDIPEPVRHGADKAEAVLDLGEILIRRIWTEKGTDVKVTRADGSEIHRPQEALNRIRSRIALDPVAFSTLRPQDQVDQVLAIAGLVPPVAKVKELTGEEFALRSPNETADSYLQRLSGDETGVFFVRRREARRTLDQKRGALEEQTKQIEALGGPLKTEEGERSMGQLLERQQHLQLRQEGRRRLEEVWKRCHQEHERGREKLEEVATANRLRYQRIEELKKQLQAEEEALAAGERRFANGVHIVKEMQAAEAEASKAFEAVSDPAEDLSQVRSQMLDIDRHNKLIAGRIAAAKERNRLDFDVARAEADHRRLHQVLEALRDLRRRQLEGIDLGVPNLMVGEGELLLNNVPFRQASQAEQIRVGFEVSVRQNPKIRVIWVDGGERLDSASLEMVEALATRYRFQLFITFVSDEDLLISVGGLAAA